jgi:hypothetical protein
VTAPPACARFVAMDIGCFECGEDSACLGIFDTEQEAKASLVEPERKQQAHWHGEHCFTVFEVPPAPKKEGE